MSIRKNILKVKKSILIEVDEAVSTTSDDIQGKALLAIKEGQGSPEWKEYMTLFVDDPSTLEDQNSISAKQLARLMGEDQTKNDPTMDQKRAYLVADSTCTSQTGLNFGRNASDVLDLGLV